jgi:hypothetical protein
VLRREIDLVSNPVQVPVVESVEMIEEPVVAQEPVEEGKGEEAVVETAATNGEEPKEEEMEDDDGDDLFGGEFDELMAGTDGFQDDMGFSNDMGWMNDV